MNEWMSEWVSEWEREGERVLSGETQKWES